MCSSRYYRRVNLPSQYLFDRAKFLCNWSSERSTLGWNLASVRRILGFMGAKEAWLCSAVVFVLFAISDARVFDTRYKRQTVVSTNAHTNGQADNVETDAVANHFKDTQGVIGMNVSSTGNATGAGSSSISNVASGQVGDLTLDTTGDVSSTGQHAESYSDIFAAVAGENKTVASFQQGKASGVGDTQAQLVAGATMNNNGMSSPNNGDNNKAVAGATGSQQSQSEVLSSQTLTWDTLMAQLVGSAVAEGIGNAQANVQFEAGNANNGIEMNGLMSGTNSQDGNVNAQVNGNGNLNGSTHDMLGNMYGDVHGKGNSTLVGASSLSSNSSEKTDIHAFGDAKASSAGNNSIDFQSETNLNENKGSGEMVLNGTAEGANVDLSGNNGIKVNDINGNTTALGSSSVHGTGTEDASNGSLVVDTSYGSDGNTQVISKGEGNSISTGGKNSSLVIGAEADVASSNGLSNNGKANATGVASGQYNNITGNSFVNVDGTMSNGNSMMQAIGGGEGPSAAESNVQVLLNEGGQLRNGTVNGKVQASGDKTFVQSISIVSDYAGQQTLSNYQHATSNSQGSSSASASNVGILKRKKRSNLSL
ncbi:unnamed protein product [Caenorhabditis auriculariae]|uniref:Uncharacterized protein n=1 Tax=Caenorhabditis auriculariae TaxID=2777116 RepID=A0A8S1GNA2_9PELO|nr:unnamed protein product [Caenorhabditis auriculariae]